MRSRLAVLMLLVVVPGIKGWAAPAPPLPAPFAILQLAPPPKGETAEDYLRDQLAGRIHQVALTRVVTDPEVRKLPSITRFKDARPWLAENLRVIEENEGRHLRFTFQAGTRAERVVILNAFLRAKLAAEEESIKKGEDGIRRYEKQIRDNERRNQPIGYLCNVLIPSGRAEVARRKQFSVIRWAK